MKKVAALLTALALMLGLCACSAKNELTTWQEQYDLGIRYLSEGNYEEAIIAFTAAIEIDPKQAPAYVGRGDAYVLSGETEENLELAKADYEMAIELDGTIVEAYLGLADVYIRRGEHEQALEILRKALEIAGGNPEIVNKIDAVEALITPLNQHGATEFASRSDFVNFADLSEDEQEWITAFAEATIAGDQEELMRLTEIGVQRTSRPFNYTMWRDYKVKVPISGLEWRNYGDGNVNKWGEIELRPENGVGYYSFVSLSRAVPSEEMDSYLEYSNTVDSITCTCTGWQWNGELSRNESHHWLWVGNAGYSRGYTVETYETVTQVGAMVDNLRSGAYTITNHRVSYSNYSDDSDETTVNTYVYENGILVEVDGETWPGGKGYQLISGNGGGRNYSNEQEFLDDLFW